MSRLNLPSSDLGKMATMACLLKNSLAELLPVKTGKEPEAGLLAHEPVGYALANMVPPQLLLRLQREVPLFQERLETLLSFRQQTRHARENLRTGLDELSRLVRDSWASLRRRSRRLQLPDSVNAFYLMPKVRMMPVNGQRRRWLEVARSVVAGDQRAVAEGYRAMVEPSAADLLQQITTVEAQLLAEAPASSLLKRAQGDMALQRIVIKDLHRDLAAYVRASLGGKPGAHRRGIMRALGFNFEVSQANAPAPELEQTSQQGEKLPLDDVLLAASPTSEPLSPKQAEPYALVPQEGSVSEPSASVLKVFDTLGSEPQASELVGSLSWALMFWSEYSATNGARLKKLNQFLSLLAAKQQKEHGSSLNYSFPWSANPNHSRFVGETGRGDRSGNRSK